LCQRDQQVLEADSIVTAGARLAEGALDRLQRFGGEWNR
jgi:hypothetical protein